MSDRRSTRQVATAVLLFVACAPAGEARAEEGGSFERAQQLFEEGERAFAAGDHDAAIEAYRQSYELVPTAGTLTNLADTLRQAGRPAEEHAALSELLDRFGEGGIRAETRTLVQERIRDLERRLALLGISCVPPGAEVTVDGTSVGACPVERPIALSPGSHEIEATLDGYEDYRASRHLFAGSRERVDIVLRAPEPDEPPPPLGERTGRLLVDSGTAEATASIDGGDPRPVPVEATLPVGEHEVELAAPGHVAQTRTVTVSAERDVMLDFELVSFEGGGEARDSHRDFWRGPWPWVIGAVVVVAVAAVTTAVLLWPEAGEQPAWLLRVR